MENLFCSIEIFLWNAIPLLKNWAHQVADNVYVKKNIYIKNSLTNSTTDNVLMVRYPTDVKYISCLTTQKSCDTIKQFVDNYIYIYIRMNASNYILYIKINILN